MSGGAGGSILSMILSLKNNKELLSKRRTYRDIRDQYEKEVNHRKLEFKKVNTAYLKELKDELRKQRRKENIALYSKLIIVFAVSFMLISWFLIYIPSTSEKKNENLEVLSKNESIYSGLERENAYKYGIKYGKYRLNHKEYFQAIGEFQLALKAYPESYEAKYYLSKTYGIICSEKDTLCDEALAQLNQLITDFDTSRVALNERANLLMHLNRFEEAELDLERLEELN